MEKIDVMLKKIKEAKGQQSLDLFFSPKEKQGNLIGHVLTPQINSAKKRTPPSPEAQVQKKAIIGQESTVNSEINVTRSLFENKDTSEPSTREEEEDMKTGKIQPNGDEEEELPRKTVNCIKRAMQELLDEKITPQKKKSTCYSTPKGSKRSKKKKY